MSVTLTMELEHEGSALRVPGVWDSGDLFWANNLPFALDAADSVARRLGVVSLLDFMQGLDEAREAAERAVYGKPADELGDEEEMTDEAEDAVDRLYYGSGPWHDPAAGLAAVEPLLAHVRAHPGDLAGCRHASGVVPDLESLRDALAEAARRCRRFRLACN